MTSSNNNRKEPKMKRFVFFTWQFTFITVTVDEKGDIVKMFMFQPGTTSRRVELKNPRIMIQGGTSDGPFIPFSSQHWEMGGDFKIAAQDQFNVHIKPKYIPTCESCGIFPVFEHIGYWSNGNKFSQGYNRNCTACEGMEDEPMPFISEAISLGEAMRDALDQIIKSLEEGDDQDFI